MGKLIIIKSNLKRIVSNKIFIVMTFLIPLIITLALGFMDKGVGETNILINSDKGELNLEYIKELNKSNNIKIYDKEDALKKVNKKISSQCYEIPDNFSELILRGEKPKIMVHRLESGFTTGTFEFNSNKLINKMILSNELKNSGVKVSLEELSEDNLEIVLTGRENGKSTDRTILSVLISFIFFSSIGVATQLFMMNKENILERSFSTANRPSTIIGAILIALFTLYSVAFSSVFVIQAAVRGSSTLENWPLYVINIVAMVFVALSLGIFVARICKNESMITVIIQVIAWITCFVGGSFAPYEFLPSAVRLFSKFTPQYWAIESLTTGNIYLAGIVILFGVVLFTAGTFKVRRFE
ncbi:ABC transporter permease [Clostridium vincentii]|uniref:ABC-2 family transporter protein n=1 Tax=Clostridium vincentii TaxID=52704 RepID=A0A2T0BBF1_9CLOT|nr:ABC transporter permease [Clostridium vincentii]PRR81229.1 ABC-2 family transporter protein [Clostridium vincentii]